MTTVSIQADTYLDLVEAGDGTVTVEACVFLGQDDEPQIVFKADLSEMLAKWVADNSIPSTPPTMRQHHKDTATSFLRQMIAEIEGKIAEVEAIELWVPLS